MTSRMRAPRSILALGSMAVLAGAACAGPAVGTVVGVPSSTSTMVQARVVTATPVVAQVTTPRQICRDEQQAVAAQGTGAGALMGAIAGGAMGNAVGKGSGNALATGIGILGGAILGDKVETNGKSGLQTVRRCEQQNAYEQRVVAYTVVYEYNGQQFSTQMAQEPGPTIPVQVTLAPAGAVAQSVMTAPMETEMVIESPPPVMRYAPPVRYAPPLVVYPNAWGWGPPGPYGVHRHRW